LPNGLSLDAGGGITGTPQQQNCNTSPFTVQVADGVQPPATKTFTIFFNGPLQIITTALPTGVALENYSFTPSASCGSGTKSWTLTGTLPLGLQFPTVNGTSSTGQISTVLPNSSGPRQTGTFGLTFTVADSSGNASRFLPLTIVGVDQQPSQGSATNNPPNLASALAVPASTRISQTFSTGVSGTLTGIRFQQFTQTVATITNISAGNPTTITTNAPHGLNSGDFININSSNSSPSVNGGWTATVLDATHFTIPASVTTAGTSGNITRNPAVLACANNSISITIEGVHADSGKPDDGHVYAGPFAATLNGPFSPTTIMLPSPLTFATDVPYAVVWSSTGACTISAGTNNDQYVQGAAYQDTGGGWATINGFFDVPMNTLVQNANLSYFTQSRNQTRAVAVTSSATAKVFIYGSQQNNNTTADMFDPATGVVTPTGVVPTIGGVIQVRQDEAIVKLQNGKVLITGGSVSGTTVNSVDLFDPSTAGNGSLGSFSSVASMATARRQHTATLLSDGRVLVVGGVTTNGNTLNSAEIYDPTQNTWTTVASMVAQRNWHTATLLADGRVLVVGGFGNGSGGNQSVEIYNPSNNT